MSVRENLIAARALSEAQYSALAALPVSITMWGGKPFSGLPKGIKTRATLFALNRLALAAVSFSGTTENWFITDAGRVALAARGQANG